MPAYSGWFGDFYVWHWPNNEAKYKWFHGLAKIKPWEWIKKDDSLAEIISFGEKFVSNCLIFKWDK